MALSPSSVTNRANSDLLSVDMVTARTELSAPERMALILRIAQSYDAATAGTPGRHAADRVLPTHHDNGARIPGQPIRTHA